jgi:hypothetical protein
VACLRMLSAVTIMRSAESRENFIVGPHKSESYHESLSLIMSLIMHLFRTNIHDLQINKCLQSLYVTTFEKL